MKLEQRLGWAKDLIGFARNRPVIVRSWLFDRTKNYIISSKDRIDADELV